MSLPKQRGDRDYFSFFQDNVAYANDAGTTVPVGRFVGGQYNLVDPTYASGDPVVFQFTSSGRLKTDASLTVEGDISIGGVEIKNASDDTRAVVKSDGINNALVVTMNVLPSLAAGSATIGDVTVSSMSALVAGTATIGSVKITDGLETLSVCTDGAVVKTKGLLFMGTDGTNAQTIATNTSGEVKVVQTTAANLNVTEASASAISSAVATPTTLTGGSTTVTTPGTAVVLGTTLATKSIYIRALSTNTSFVCVGDSNVDEGAPATQQIILYANDSVTIDIANRVTVYLDADVGTEGVSYLCMS